MEGAKLDYDSAIYLNANFANAFLNRGFTQKILGNYEEAANDFKLATLLMPDNPKAHNALGNIRVLFSDYSKAIADFTNALRLDNNYAAAYFNRGLAKILLYNSIGGCEDLSKAIELGFEKAEEYKRSFCGNF